MYEIVLASASPRRSHLLALLGVKFRTDVSSVAEDLSGPHDAVERARDLALAKARAVSVRHPRHIILAADTLIAFRGRLLGKPLDGDDAVAMLRALRGAWHRVITGVAVLNTETGEERATAEVTRVLMRRYSDDEIEAYVASGDPMDKAAAYAIQHRGFHPVEKLNMCYTNVMGLPLCTTRDLLGQAGVSLPATGEYLRTERCAFCGLARA